MHWYLGGLETNLPLIWHFVWNCAIDDSNFPFGKSKTHVGRIFLKVVKKIKKNFVPLHLGFEKFNGRSISENYTPEFFRLLFENGISSYQFFYLNFAKRNYKFIYKSPQVQTCPHGKLVVDATYIYCQKWEFLFN